MVTAPSDTACSSPVAPIDAAAALLLLQRAGRPMNWTPRSSVAITCRRSVSPISSVPVSGKTVRETIFFGPTVVSVVQAANTPTATATKTRARMPLGLLHRGDDPARALALQLGVEIERKRFASARVRVLVAQRPGDGRLGVVTRDLDVRRPHVGFDVARNAEE